MQSSEHTFVEDSLAERIAKAKYYQPGETWESMSMRVAKTVVQGGKMRAQRAGKCFDIEEAFWLAQYFNLVNDKVFLPGGRVLANAGTGVDNLANCFVLNMEDSREGIYDALKTVAEIHAKGGGTGLDFSSLREEGATISSTGGESSGPVSFMRLFDVSGEVIKQGSRRAAMLAAMDITHPDIFKFTTAKLEEGKLKNFNISVKIPDSVMEAYLEGGDVDIVSPLGYVVRTVPAKELIHKIAELAWATGDPGILFIDTINKYNPFPENGKIIGTNPCVAGDSIIFTNTGPQYIQDVVGKESEVLTRSGYSSNSGIVLTKHNAATVKVTLSTGQVLKVTPEHEFICKRGKVSAKDLNTSDKVFLNTTEIKFGSGGTRAEGFIYGAVAGDGTILNTGSARLCLYGKKKELREVVEEYTGKEVTHGEDMDTLHLPYKEYPDAMHGEFNPKFFKLSKEFLSGYLSGIVSTDGSVWNSGNSRISIVVSSKNKSFLLDLQTVLSFFGIVSAVKNESLGGTQNFNDGYGYYLTAPTYRLLITGKNVELFMQRVGLHECKQQADILKEYFSTHSFYSQRNVASVISVEADATVDVYDVVNTHDHTFYANGILVSNCGEIPGVNGSSCILGSINLTKFLYKSGNKWGFDTAAFQYVIAIATNFLNDVMEVTKTGVELFDRVKEEEKKIGLGVMGFADVLVALRLAYDSDEAREFAELLGKIMQETSGAVSRKLAMDYGSFHPNYDTYNSALLAVAPTGTLSLVSGVNYAAEPFFALAYKKNFKYGGDKTVERTIISPESVKTVLYEEFDKDIADKILWNIATTGHIDIDAEFSEKINSRILELKPILVTAHDLSPDARIAMQASWQKYVDQSISSTVNLPNSATVDDVERIILEAWKKELKGFTIFRDGCRNEQVLEKV